MDDPRGQKPAGWNLAGQIMYWFTGRSNRWRSNALAIVLVVFVLSMVLTYTDWLDL